MRSKGGWKKDGGKEGRNGWTEGEDRGDGRRRRAEMEQGKKGRTGRMEWADIVVGVGV